MLTLITHFFNEEYLLPWWCRHHRPYVDRCILIDYDSTDRSAEIIKKLCPEWEVIVSRNRDFNAANNTQEVQDLEHSLTGWRIALNVTEFLVGDYNILKEKTTPMRTVVPILGFVDDHCIRESADPDQPLYKQITSGYPIEESFQTLCMGRSLHNYNFFYDNPGRHYPATHHPNFVIFKYQFAPMTKELIQRKLQIQTRIPESDRLSGAGWHHTNKLKGLTEPDVIEMWKEKRTTMVDLTDYMRYYLNLNGIEF